MIDICFVSLICCHKMFELIRPLMCLYQRSQYIVLYIDSWINQVLQHKRNLPMFVFVHDAFVTSGSGVFIAEAVSERSRPRIHFTKNIGLITQSMQNVCSYHMINNGPIYSASAKAAEQSWHVYNCELPDNWNQI